MTQQQVCTWCQSEIAWDEELGPETTCPHCYNELSEYRTLAVPLKREAAAIPFDEETNDHWSRYSRAAEAYLDAQEEALECPLCQEYMVLAGEQHVPESHFVPKAPLPQYPAFLRGPYRMDVFVCSHCFTVHQRLSEKDRTALVKRLGDSANDDLEE
jgi:hypothetical protein